MGLQEAFFQNKQAEKPEDIQSLTVARRNIMVQAETLHLKGKIIYEEYIEFGKMIASVEKKYLSKYPENSHNLVKIYENMNKIMLFGTMLPGTEDIKNAGKQDDTTVVRNFRSAWKYYKDAILELQHREPFFGKLT